MPAQPQEEKPRKTPKVSRREVARAAGVSVTTVTHALNPPPGARVNPDTVARVKRVANELGYRPSFVGRALVSGKSMVAGVLLPNRQLAGHQFYQDILFGMTRAMEPDDYHLLLLFRSEDDRYLKPIQQGRVDGMFVLQSDAATNHIDRLVDIGIPTVVVNRDFPPRDNKRLGCVRHDHEAMMQAAVDELVGLRCRTLLLVVDVRWIDANARMYAAYVAAASRHANAGVVGSVMNPAHEGDFRIAIRNALRSGQRWDGFFLDKLADAEALLDEAEDVGLTAGRDFHLITTDTTDGATTSKRQEQSAYTQQPERLGHEAWQMLRALIRGEEPGALVKVPYHRIAVRQPALSPAQ